MTEMDVSARQKLAYGCVVLLAGVSFWLVYLAVGSSTSQLKVAFLDVGQGDATLVETPSGNQVLIDGGRAGSANRPLSEQLPFYDRSLDMVVASHADSDHIGGLPGVLKDYRVDHVVTPARSAETAAWKALQKSIRQEQAASSARLHQARAGDVFRLGAGVYLITLAPPEQASPADKNKSSSVFKLIYGDTSLLLTGDIPAGMERLLAQMYGSFLQSDLLKVAHHGADTSSSAPFLSAVAPSQAVISAGRNNSYGHPDPKVVERLKGITRKTMCTCDTGTVSFVSDGREFEKLD